MNAKDQLLTCIRKSLKLVSPCRANQRPSATRKFHHTTMPVNGYIVIDNPRGMVLEIYISEDYHIIVDCERSVDYYDPADPEVLHSIQQRVNEALA